ncbi:type II secretion system F family protein [Arcanobacterium ihumii]|uniref:type II secretion system F family protein n=1 Tax=Arcanobacterium ihumii TaxID=2138162 RepID=UPI000F534C18|nr:type II secretion system F family protein [Arcanobacterium ihumii]
MTIILVFIVAFVLWGPRAEFGSGVKRSNSGKPIRFAAQRRLFGLGVQHLYVDQSIILDLAAAALNAGISIPRTLEAVDVALGNDDTVGNATLSLGKYLNLSGKRNLGSPRALTEVANSLIMGARWGEAWEGTNPRFQLLAQSLEPAWNDGAAPVPLLERSAHTLRLTRQRQAKEAAARLGARLVVPLSLCFLPAFMLIGVLPVVVLAAQNVL